MHWVVVDELLNFRQPGWKWHTIMASVTEETKAGSVKSFDVEPLLGVASSGRLEGPAHPMEQSSAVGALGLLRPGGNLETLTAREARMCNEVTPTHGWRHRCRWHSPPQCPPSGHSAMLLTGIHTGSLAALLSLPRSFATFSSCAGSGRHNRPGATASLDVR